MLGKRRGEVGENLLELVYSLLLIGSDFHQLGVNALKDERKRRCSFLFGCRGIVKNQRFIFTIDMASSGIND